MKKFKKARGRIVLDYQMWVPEDATEEQVKKAVAYMHNITVDTGDSDDVHVEPYDVCDVQINEIPDEKQAQAAAEFWDTIWKLAKERWP